MSYADFNTESAMQRKPLLLLVDDVPSNIKLLDIILSDQYEIAVAMNGEQALEIALEKLPDLILLDIMMPGGMDGLEVCRRLKMDLSTAIIPVIFITAKAQAEDVVKGFDAGGVDYVTKPFHSAELLARVRTHVQLHRLKSLLHVCSYCNRVRDDENWKELQAFIYEKTGARFSHGICPQCNEKAKQQYQSAKNF